MLPADPEDIVRPFLFLCLTTLLACGGEATPEPSTSAPAPPAAAPTRTRAALATHEEIVHGFQPWDAALARLVERFGPPDRVEDTRHLWFGRDGEACVALSVENMAGSVGGITLEPATGCP